MTRNRWAVSVAIAATLVSGACSDHARTPLQLVKCGSQRIAECEAPVRHANLVVSVDKAENVFAIMQAAIEHAESVAVLDSGAQTEPPAVRLRIEPSSGIDFDAYASTLARLPHVVHVNSRAAM